MALIVASVPLETSRSCSTGATRATISSASATSFSHGVPKEVPREAASCTASRTAGWAWPRIIGPQLPTRSTYSRPSASVRYGPDPRTMKRGVPPTERNARTGELTPPGVTARARARRAAEAGASSPWEGAAGISVTAPLSGQAGATGVSGVVGSEA